MKKVKEENKHVKQNVRKTNQWQLVSQGEKMKPTPQMVAVEVQIGFQCVNDCSLAISHTELLHEVI